MKKSLPLLFVIVACGSFFYCSPQETSNISTLTSPPVVLPPELLPKSDIFPVKPKSPIVFPQSNSPKLCQDGFCWEHPIPQGNRIYKQWGTKSESMWAVGDEGTILHYDGKDWAWMESGTTENLMLIWGSTENDIWVVAEDSSLLHYDGTSWQRKGNLFPKTEDFYSTYPVFIQGSGPQDIWIGYTDSNIQHDGKKTKLFHYDGMGWTLQTSLPNTNNFWIGEGWVHKQGEIWLPGSFSKGGYLFYYNGNNWIEKLKLPQEPNIEYRLTSVSGRSENDIWVAGSKEDTSNFYPEISPILYHYDGVKWEDRISSSTKFPSSVKWDSRIRSYGTSDVLFMVWPILGDNWDYFRYDGMTWTKIIIPENRSNNLGWGFSTKDFWLTSGTSQMYHFDGTVLQSVGNQALRGAVRVGGTSPQDLWAVEWLPNSPIFHYDGSTWTHLYDAPKGVRSIFGVTPDDVWFGGDFYTLFHYNGTSFDKAYHGGPTKEGITPPAYTIQSIWGSSKDDIWAVGDFGFVVHYDGKNWTRVYIPGLKDWSFFRKVIGFGKDHVWLISLEQVFFFDGTIWHERTPSAPKFSLSSIWGSNEGDIWLFGTEEKNPGPTRSILFRFIPSENRFVQVSLPVINEPYGDWGYDIWGANQNDIWTISKDGALIHYDGKQWELKKRGGWLQNGSINTPLSLFGLTNSNEMWIAGDGVLLHRKN